MRKVWLSLLVAGALSVLYWAAFLAVAYSVLAGDRRDGGGPGSGAWVLVIGAGVALYALALWLWWAWAGRAWRPLTAGELAAARAVFGDAIAWDRVRIYPRGFTPFQPRNVAVTPLGAVHFRRADFRPDFSGSWSDMAWLIHELVHVWQHQSGVPVLLRGLVERRYHYDSLDPAKPFARYGIEQQAAIVEDWFRRTRGIGPRYGAGSEADYRAVIPFLPKGSEVARTALLA
jgi:hypothetical protein